MLTKQNKRAKMQDMMRRARRAGAHYSAFLVNRFKRKEKAGDLGDEYAERLVLISGMTNWQRTQYSRAVQKGVVMPIEQVRYFANLNRASRQPAGVAHVQA